jgi:hypothetical protein
MHSPTESADSANNVNKRQITFNFSPSIFVYDIDCQIILGLNTHSSSTVERYTQVFWARCVYIGACTRCEAERNANSWEPYILVLSAAAVVCN